MSTTEHAEFEEKIGAYLTGELSPLERAEMQAHAAVCGACAAALQEAVEADQRVEGLFKDERPDVGFEDRIIRALRGAKGRGMGLRGMGLRSLRPLRLVHPSVPRAVSGIAAALVLGACGYFASGLIEDGKLPLTVQADRSELPDKLADSRPARQMALGDLAAYYSDSRGVQAQWDDDEQEEAGVAHRMRSPAEVARQSQRGLWERRTQAEPRILTRGEVDAKAAQQGLQENRAKRFSEVNTVLTRGKAEPSGDEVLRESVEQGVKAAEEGPKPGAAQAGSREREDAAAASGPEVATLAYDQAAFGVTASSAWSAPAEGRVALHDAEAAGAAKVDFFAAQVSNGGRGNAPANGVSFGTNWFGKPDSATSADVFYRNNAPAVVGKPLEPARYFKPMGGGGASVNNPGAGVEGKKLGGIQKDLPALKDLADGSDPADRPVPDEKLAVAEEQTTPPAQTGAPAPASSEAPGQPAAPRVGAEVQAVVERPVQQQPAQATRKIIRNGEMEFEVESFDSAFVTITKIVTEDGGFVSSTNSEKLPNGKVKGTVIVRVPPDRLDTFVLKLRALGDLKSQKISAQDVTKVYNDLESELKAGRAMEERLLNIIKSGKGEIKDLLEAEKQLGVYREKIEKLEGEIRYYNNLVAMSTMSITAYERDIKTPAYASQTETVGMGIETDAVEKARAEALKAIEEAKGRVIESNLKQHDAGQLAATIVAEVAPDAAGPLTDRLKQLGRVARLDVDRKTATPSGVSGATPTRVDRRDTQLSISIYNLANVAPRQTTNATLAVANVEEAYRTILALVRDKTGRIVTSTLNRQKPEQTTASISFEIPAADAETMLTELRREREVLGLTVTENPDTNNVTTAKRGFSVQIQSLATVPPRETEQLVLTSKGDVAEAFSKLVAEAKKADARILVSQLNEQDRSNITASLDVEVLRTKEVDLRAALTASADTVSRQVSRASEAENTVDSKVRLQMRLMSLDRLAARETQNMGLAVADVQAAYQGLLSTLAEQGVRVISSQINEKDPRNVMGSLDFEVPREKKGAVDKALAAVGVVHSRAVSRSSDRQNSIDSKVRMQVSVSNVSQLPPRQTTTLMLEVDDVEKRTAEVLSQAESAGGRTAQSTLSKTTDGRMTSQIVVDLPLAEAQRLRDQVQGMGEVRFKESSTDPKAPDGQVARARLDITLGSPEALVGRDEGLAASLKHAIATSVKGLLWSLQLIVVGLLFVGPWALLLWAAWKLLRRKPKPAVA